MQYTNNYRFDCEFVLKYYSNCPIFHMPNSFCKMFERRALIRLNIDSRFPSQRKLYAVASNACKKTYLNKFFIWESSLSDFLPIFIDKT